MRNQRQRLRVAALTALMLLLSGIGSACRSSTFRYSVHVTDNDTGLDVQGAKITIHPDKGEVPVTGITDHNGYARIEIDASYVGQPANLFVDATGYKRYPQAVTLGTDNLPLRVPLEPENAPDPEPPDTPEPAPTTAIPPDTPAPGATTAVPTPSPEPKPTDTPPPTPTPVPEGLAIAIESAGIFAAPDASSQVMGGVSVGELVSVLGRSAAGQWFYVRDGQGAEGFVYAPRFQWSGDFASLPVRDPLIVPPTATDTPGAPPAPLDLDLWHLPDTGWCKGGWWYMSVWIQGYGGDGVYTYYWNEEKLAGPLADEGLTFELSTTEGAIVGNGRVVSGDGQVVEKGLFIPAPDCAQ